MSPISHQYSPLFNAAEYRKTFIQSITYAQNWLSVFLNPVAFSTTTTDTHKYVLVMYSDMFLTPPLGYHNIFCGITVWV